MPRCYFIILYHSMFVPLMLQNFFLVARGGQGLREAVACASFIVSILSGECTVQKRTQRRGKNREKVEGAAGQEREKQCRYFASNQMSFEKLGTVLLAIQVLYTALCNRTTKSSLLYLENIPVRWIFQFFYVNRYRTLTQLLQPF